MKTFDTLSEAISDLRSRGYSTDFNLQFNGIVCHQTPINLLPQEFEIVEVYRFEGATNPDDQSVLYAIESQHGLKGILVNAYGIYADPVSEEMVRKLAIRHTGDS